ncbi:MAG: penicillin-binding protein 2 [Candidatus Daviesbacteria bacterium]|nr:penicillin-binding protein 2 [Candidatus Daviesbacteria bacterium]
MRIKVIQWFFLSFLLAIALRLFYWQIIQGDALSAKADDQHFVGNKMEATRGAIYFTDGAVLADSKPVFSLFTNPKVIKDSDRPKVASDLAKILAPIDYPDDVKKNLPQEYADLQTKLSQNLFYVSLHKDLNLEVKNKIESLSINGIFFEQSSNRFYPEGSSSAHLLGFVGSDARGENTGYFGLEGYYDGELKGIPGYLRNEKDALGAPILIGNFFGSEPTNGKDLVLNIDRTIQYIVEQNLRAGMEKYGAKAASVVVMDPKTGAILALATYPNYDPANFSQFPREYYRNSVVADQYEPGSTFKVLVMAAAIDQDVVKPDTKCDSCTGPVSVGGFLIRTWDNKYFPDISMKDVIVHSDNTGMVFVGKKLGLDKFYSYLENFGFGSLTNIDLQDEFAPDLRPKDTWREIDLATASFGQGIAVTPIQMVRAVAVIANGGLLVQPEVVKQIKDDKAIFTIKPKVIRQVIKPATSQVIKEMMVAAVDQGEARVFKPKGFKIAGKTGTAQIPVAGHYDPTKTIASFVGFAPADDPKFVMLVRYDQPSASIFGAETAAPTFFNISKQLFPYLKIAPTE